MSPSRDDMDSERRRFESLGAEALGRRIDAGEFGGWRLDVAKEVLPRLRRQEALEQTAADRGALSTGAQLEANTLTRVAIGVSIFAALVALWALTRTF